MLRVFHVPSHLSYVDKLVGDHSAPAPSPLGRPLRVSDLLALDTWDFFDVLHLHTVELATAAELGLLCTRLRESGKGLVFTLHDLIPNIETDHAAFAEKTRLAAHAASSVITLTHAAGEQAMTCFGIEPTIIPHGYAVSPRLVGQRGGDAFGLLVFGALRPNRHIPALVRAWHLLPATRPPLHVLLRSVGALDQQRHADDLAELHKISRAAPDLIIETASGVLPARELVEYCRQVSALVLPYTHITHSGQLELARDLGHAAVVPDVPTLRAQVSEAAGDEDAHIWFPTAALAHPVEFASYLNQVTTTSNTSAVESAVFAQYRMQEHHQLLAQYEVAYNRSCDRR